MSTSTTIKEVMRELAALEDSKMREANERRGDSPLIQFCPERAMMGYTEWMDMKMG